MFSTRIAKHLCCTRRICDSPRLLHDQAARPSRVRSVLEEGLQASGEHLLESNDQHTVRSTMRNHIPAHVETGRASRAVVVDVVYWDTGHAELIEDALSAGAVAVAVACNTLVYIVVVNVCVKHGFHTSFETEFRVVDLSARLDELGHAYAEDVYGLLLADHGGGSYYAIL